MWRAQAHSFTIALTLSRFMAPSFCTATAFVPPSLILSDVAPAMRRPTCGMGLPLDSFSTQHYMFPLNLPELARKSHVAQQQRKLTCTRMVLEDWNDDEKNATDIYSKVGAAGNLRFPGMGFKPPEVPEIDQANFKVIQDLEAAKNFEEKQKTAKFSDLVEFPCKFQIKVVGARQGEFVEDILDSIGGVVKVGRDDLPHSFRDKGKWRSITVYEVYAAIEKDPRVKFKF